MANNFISNQAAPVTGLGTYSFTVVNPGLYTFRCKAIIPCDPSGSALNSAASDPAQSNLQIALQQNASNLITPVGGSAANPTPRQGSLSADVRLSAVAGDVLSVVLSSSNAIDNLPNSVKGTINLFQGY